MGVGEIIEQNGWVLKAMGVALAGALAGSAVMTTVATKALLDVSPISEENPAAATSKPQSPTPAASSSYEVTRRAAKEQAAADILGYNPFCHGCTPPEPAADPAMVAAPVADAPLPPLALRVVATMESTDPAGSLATIYDTQRGTTALYAVGERVGSTLTVTAIGGGVVEFTDGNALRSLRVGESIPPAVAPRKPRTTRRRGASKAASAARKTTSSSLAGASDAILCSNANTCVVERAFVDKLMANPASLATQAAVRPTSQGFALTRVRSGSLPALLGLQRGDVLTEVNGQALDSVDKVLTLATKLRRASTLEVTLLRGGKQVRKEIQIS